MAEETSMTVKKVYVETMVFSDAVAFPSHGIVQLERRFARFSFAKQGLEWSEIS